MNGLIDYRYATLQQRLNDYILIWFIELKPFTVDRLNNGVFRELDQNESKTIQNNIQYLSIASSTVPRY